MLTFTFAYNPISPQPTAGWLCHPNSTYTALGEETHNFHIVETGYTFSIFNATPPLPLLPLFDLPSVSLASSSQSTHLLNVGMPQSSFFSLLFLSIYILLDYSRTPIAYHWWDSYLCLYFNSTVLSPELQTHRLLSIWHPDLGVPLASQLKKSQVKYINIPLFLLLLCLSLGDYHHSHSCPLPNVNCPWFLSCPPHLITRNNQTPVQSPFWISLYSSSSRGLLP